MALTVNTIFNVFRRDKNTTGLTTADKPLRAYLLMIVQLFLLRNNTMALLLYCNVDWLQEHNKQQANCRRYYLRRTLDRLTVTDTPRKQLTPVVSSETLHSSVAFPFKKSTSKQIDMHAKNK